MFAPRTSPSDYLAYLAAADLFLDTYPYNAGTVASDAIRMHLPLVTLSGRSFAWRMAGRLLAALGGHNGIAVTVQDYVEKAVTPATDRSRYAAYKALFTDEGLGGDDRQHCQVHQRVREVAAVHREDAAAGVMTWWGAPIMNGPTHNR